MAAKQLSARVKRVRPTLFDLEVITPAMLDAGMATFATVQTQSAKSIVEAIYRSMRLTYPKYNPIDVARFQRFVPNASPDECWEWLGARKSGWGEYGKFSMRCGYVGAHIAAWEMANEQLVPKGMVVCHSCDNPPCVNPKHLWIGSISQNMADMWGKGRGRPSGLDAKGSRNSQAILNETDVINIRRRIAAGERQTDIARSYGVTIQAVNRIHRGVAWMHVKVPTDDCREKIQNASSE